MNHPKRRGVSVGTVIMLALTSVVLVLSIIILPRLMSTDKLRLSVSRLQNSTRLSSEIPGLEPVDIPIADATSTPPAAVTPVVSATPAEVATPVPAPTATPVPASSSTITITIGGTVEIDETLRSGAYGSDTGNYDFTKMLSLLDDEMRADLSFVSLLNITDDSSSVSAVNAPASVMDMLSAAGIDAISLAYPNAYDKGIAGIQATVSEAHARNLGVSGVYPTENDAQALPIFSANGIDVAYLSYTDVISSSGKKALRSDGNAYALPGIQTASGVADGAAADTRAARAMGAEIVIVTLNWSDSNTKSSVRQKIYDQLAAAGADVIVNTGSRNVQGVSWLTTTREDGTTAQTLLASSLGSILNGSRKDASVAGMLLQLEISCTGSSVSFKRVCYTPTYIWRYKQDGQYQYRVTPSDLTPPNNMSDDQTSYMQKAYRNIQKALDGSPITLRIK